MCWTQSNKPDVLPSCPTNAGHSQKAAVLFFIAASPGLNQKASTVSSKDSLLSWFPARACHSRSCTDCSKVVSLHRWRTTRYCGVRTHEFSEQAEIAKQPMKSFRRSAISVSSLGRDWFFVYGRWGFERGRHCTISGVGGRVDRWTGGDAELTLKSFGRDTIRVRSVGEELAMG